AAGSYRLRAQSGGQTAVIGLSIVSIDTAITIPSGQTLLAVRHALRTDPTTGRQGAYVGVLTQGTGADGKPFSLLRTFGPNKDNPIVQVMLSGSNRFTDFGFADLAGNGNPYLVGAGGKSQAVPDVTSRVVILDPATGAQLRQVTLQSTRM